MVLDGTGDSSLNVTCKVCNQQYHNLDSVGTGDLSAKNSAAVMITADLDPFAKVGQQIGILVLQWVKQRV